MQKLNRTERPGTVDSYPLRQQKHWLVKWDDSVTGEKAFDSGAVVFVSCSSACLRSLISPALVISPVDGTTCLQWSQAAKPRKFVSAIP